MTADRAFRPGDKVELTPANGDEVYVAKIASISDVGVVLDLTEGPALFPWPAVARLLRK